MSWWKSEPVVPTKFKFKAKHIPSNRSWEREKEFPHRGAFLSELARWNRIDPKTWVYTEISS